MFDVSRQTDFGARGRSGVTAPGYDANARYAGPDTDPRVPGPSANARYAGPERRNVPARSPHWLAATLDEIDYGMLLLSDETQVIHVNHIARAELDPSHPLQLLGRKLRARRPDDVQPLAEALQAAARRGLRKLLTLGAEAQRVSLSVVPLTSPFEPGWPVTLVMLGKHQVGEGLSVQGFATSHGLTPAESRVLAALCRGTPPTEIAAHFGVRIATVRTQIGNIRLKTGTESISDLVRRVAALPPLLGVLRGVGGHPCVACDDSALTSA